MQQKLKKKGDICDLPNEKYEAPVALVIIPTYNEADNIEKLLVAIFKMYPSSVDVLVIDDNSPDGTADIVREVQAYERKLHLVTRAGKLGLGTAYLNGFAYALDHGYRFIIEMDADYSHDPEMIRTLLEKMAEADLVLGSRYLNNTVNVINWPLRRLILSKAASIYTRYVSGLPVSDPTSGFKCFKREVLETLDLKKVHSEGYSFQIEMNYRVWKKGFAIVEVPIVFTDRTVGKSKMTRKNIREAIWIVWLLKLKTILRML